MPASAEAWFRVPSPKVQTTMASSGNGRDGTSPSRLARSMAKAVPMALGTCEAIVLVCGGIHRAVLPNTLWRPPAIGSSELAHRDSSTSNTGVWPATCLARCAKKPPDR